MVLVVTSHVAGGDAPIISTPTTMVQKRLPGRTTSGDYRVISDLRYPNLFFDKADYPEVITTDINQIAERAIAMKMKWPHLNILRNKRDIDSAFKRIKVHPDMCAIMRTEFDAKKLGMDEEDVTVLFLYLAPPFRWRASPAFFPHVGEGITTTRKEFISHDVKRDGSDYFCSLLFAGDAISIEPCLGKRQEMVISCWGHVCRKLLGDSAINADKVRLEGTWIPNHILLGFEANVNDLTIKLPTAMAVGAWNVIQDPMLNHGNRIANVEAIQELRGLLNHWRYANRFWRYMASPVNGLMSFSDSTDTWIRCGNDQVWPAFWNLIASARAMSEVEEARGNLSRWDLEKIISAPKQVGQKKGKGKTVWATGDAVLDKIGSNNWETKEYIWGETEGFLSEITPPHRRVVISDPEQLESASIILTWGKASVLQLMGTDNRNVMAWTRKGYAKKGWRPRLEPRNFKVSGWIGESK